MAFAVFLARSNCLKTASYAGYNVLVNADEHGGYESDREVYVRYKRELETLKDYIHSYACNPDFNPRQI